MLIDSNILISVLRDEGGVTRLYADKALKVGGEVAAPVVAEVCNTLLAKERGYARAQKVPFGTVAEQACNRDNAKSMLELFGKHNLTCDTTVQCALETMMLTGLDFVDNYLYVKGIECASAIATSDKDLSELLQDSHWEP